MIPSVSVILMLFVNTSLANSHGSSVFHLSLDSELLTSGELFALFYLKHIFSLIENIKLYGETYASHIIVSLSCIILSEIKDSYADMLRRITMLIKQLQSLSHRTDQHDN